MEMGAFLRKIRKAAGLKQYELALMIGVAPNFLCDIEKGRCDLPEKYLPKLPSPIREGLAQWLIERHERAIEELRQAG